MPQHSIAPPAKFQSTRPRGARRIRASSSPSTALCFNPRAREGRDCTSATTRALTSWFQSTRPRGARRIPPRCMPYLSLFQSTRPRGARRRRAHDSRADPQFQSTRPRGARLIDDKIIRRPKKFQSTRPRGARLANGDDDIYALLVSIHAPARGATRPHPRRLRACRWFQSTRPRGARLAEHAHKRDETSFNPRAREGRDLSLVCSSLSQNVSIHAPARGATNYIA